MSNVMPHPDDPDALFVPLFEALTAIGFGEHEDVHHFNTGTLFWSLTRLFGYYERVVSVLQLPRENREFLAADIESYIIRFRIVLNDIAYVVRQLLPAHARDFKGPTGGVHPDNREVSFFTLAKDLAAQHGKYPELASAFSQAALWVDRLRNDRDNVVHYKSKAVVFETNPPSFALLSAAGTELPNTLPDGGTGPHLQPIQSFVNEQMLSLHDFMHVHLTAAVRSHATRLSLKQIPVGWDRKMICVGIQTFRRANPNAA